MPKFILNAVPSIGLNVIASHPFYALNDFAKGYVEAMFFTNGDTGDDREDLLNELGVEALTRAAVKAIKKDCANFEHRARKLLPLAYSLGVTPEGAGRDFWFTRQGHRVGFWGREELAADIYLTASGAACLKSDFNGSEASGQFLGVLGDLLSAMARASGAAHCEVNRKRIHYGR